MHATTFVLMDEDELAQRSTAVVIGTVTAVDVAADDTAGGVFTYVSIAAEGVLAGAVPQADVVLREPGGQMPSRTERIFGSPEYEIGERVVVFVRPDADGWLRTTGMAMGKFTVEEDSDGQASVTRNFGTGVAVLDRAAGTLVTEPRQQRADFAALTRRVRRVQNVGAAATGERQGRLALGGDGAERWEAFKFLGSTPARWFEPDSDTPLAYRIDATGYVGIGAEASHNAILSAFAAWNGIATARITLTDGGAVEPVPFSGCSAGSRVIFNDPGNEIDDPVNCGGVLAVGGYCTTNEQKTVNGTTFRRIAVGKVTFNNGWQSCAAWNPCNLAEVATHEIGHTLGFGHSEDTSATMAAYAHFDQRCASVKPDDINAAIFTYPLSLTPGPSPQPTRTFTPSNAPTPTRTVTRTQTPFPAATATTTASRTPTRTASPTRTATASPSATRTASPSPPFTFTATASPTHSPTPTATASATFTASATATASATDSPQPTPTPTATHTATLPATATPTTAPSDTPTATFTPSLTPTSTLSPTPTDTETASPTASDTSTPSATPTRTFTATPTASATATDTATATATRTDTPTRTAPHTSTATRTATPTRTATATATHSPTPTLTATATFTSSPTPSATFTATATATHTATRTASRTSTPTWTPTATRTATATATFTRSATPTASPTATPTRTATRTATSSATATYTSTVTQTHTPPATSTSTRTPTRTWTSTPTHTLAPTVTRTSTPSRTPTPTLTATRTPSSTATRTTLPTATATTRPTASPTSTHTATATRTTTSTRTPTPSSTVPPTDTATAVPTRTPTTTRTRTATRTATALSSETPTATPTSSRTPTATASRTSTPEPTATDTASPTAIATQTDTPTWTATATASFTPSSTSTSTSTMTPSATATATATATTTATVTATATDEPTAEPTATPTMTATSTAEPSSTPTAAPLFSVSGHIYHADSAVSVDDVIVRLRDLDAEHVATAGSSGYQLGAIPPGPCEIEPAKIDFIRNAISAYDAAYILQSLGGERALDPFQQQACDVTGDGQLDESDVSTILQMTVGIDRRFPAGVACGSDWLFAPRGTSEATREMLPPRLDGTCQPGRIVFSSLTTSAAGQDFDARLIGDCTGNWPTTIVAGGGALSNGEPMNARASTGRVRRARGQSVQVPLFVRTDRPYYSLEAEIAYDPTEVQPTDIQLRPSSKGATVSYHLVSPGKLRVALASAKAIEHQAAAVLRVAFTRARGTVTNDPVRLMALKVDEQVIDMNAPLLRARTQSQRHR